MASFPSLPFPSLPLHPSYIPSLPGTTTTHSASTFPPVPPLWTGRRFHTVGDTIKSTVSMETESHLKCLEVASFAITFGSLDASRPPLVALCVCVCVFARTRSCVCTKFLGTKILGDGHEFHCCGGFFVVVVFVFLKEKKPR